jgi:hypothetical protein
MILNSTQQAALREAIAYLDDLAERGALGDADATSIRAGSAALTALVNAAEPEIAERAAARAVSIALPLA